MPNRITISRGDKFNRLTFQYECAVKQNRRRGLFTCECGKEIETTIWDVKHGHTKSCGCYHTEVIRQAKTHGEASLRNGYSREYVAWKAMKERCYSRSNVSYPNYGGRGIRVCQRWLNSFANFLADLGRKPTKSHSLDRINNNGNYTPKNCKWSTRSEQRRNSRCTLTYVEHDGKRLLITDWSKVSGVPEESISSRLRNGWPVQDAIFKPVVNRRHEGGGLYKYQLIPR